MSGALWHFFWTDTDWVASASTSAAPSLSIGTGGAPAALFMPWRRRMSAERQWWLDELRRRYMRRMREVREAVPSFESEVAAAIAAHAPPPDTPIAADTPAGQIDTAATYFELQTLLDARDRAETAALAISDRAQLRRLGGQVATLSARIATLEAQRADDDVLLFILPHLFP